MPETCCCGCITLSSATKIAITICAFEAIIGVLWNTELLLLLVDPERFNPLQMVMNIKVMDDFDVVHGLTLAGLGLNAIWLFAAIVAARGNITLNHARLAFWDVVTYFVVLYDTGATIYYTIKTQGYIAQSQDLFQSDTLPTSTLTYMVLLFASSKGVILLLINVFFAHIVQMRGKEIDHDHSVLALYILSHLARCRAGNDNVPQTDSGAPPPYASSCPFNVNQSNERSDSGSSTWSLSYDAMKDMSHISTYPSFQTDLRSSFDMARAISRNSSTQHVDIETTTLLP